MPYDKRNSLLPSSPSDESPRVLYKTDLREDTSSAVQAVLCKQCSKISIPSPVSVLPTFQAKWCVCR